MPNIGASFIFYKYSKFSHIGNNLAQVEFTFAPETIKIPHGVL